MSLLPVCVILFIPRNTHHCYEQWNFQHLARTRIENPTPRPKIIPHSHSKIIPYKEDHLPLTHLPPYSQNNGRHDAQDQTEVNITIPYMSSFSFSNLTMSSSSSQVSKSTSPTFLLAPVNSFPPPSTIFPSIPKLNLCLQYQLLDLKCSFTTAAHVMESRVRLNPSFPKPDEGCCERCKRNDEAFCIRQISVGERRDVEYRADGVNEWGLRKRVGELFEESDGKGRWALPMAPKEHREAINPERWLWKQEDEDAEGSGEIGEIARQRTQK